MNEDDAACLSQLLKALGAGARAVQALPLSTTKSSNTKERESKLSNNNNTNILLEDDDEFAFEASFPEFAAALSQAQESERNVLILILHEIASHTTALDFEEWDSSGSTGTTTAELFELSATACDWLLEQVEVYLSQPFQLQAPSNNIHTNNTTQKQLTAWSQTARQKSQSAWSTILNNVVEMEKPQRKYQMTPPCNGRGQIFRPAVHLDKPFGTIKDDKSTLVLQDGHGYDTCHGTLLSSNQAPKYADPLLVLPSQHIPHYYQSEIESFVATDWELQPLTTKPLSTPPPLLSSSSSDQEKAHGATWIDTPMALEEFGRRLSSLSSSKSLKMMALDLEAHSYRSFAGMVCLMQCTLILEDATAASSPECGKNDAPPLSDSGILESYLIDTLQLSAKSLNRTLQGPLANPHIVKLLHGADSDIAWLQRDFGLYIVHLWDTGRAARALQFPSASYAYLLSRYCLSVPQQEKGPQSSRLESSVDSTTTTLVRSIVQGKQQFQLSDWRQRPLPLDMQQYAVADTHFLAHIAHHLKWELQQKQQANTNNTLMMEVLDTSRQVSLIRYPGPPLFSPVGYRKLLLGSGGKRSRKRNSKPHQHQYTPLQESVLKALWDWRDSTAREVDESTGYICPNTTLLRLAMVMPSSAPLPGNLKLPDSDLESRVVTVIQTAVKQFTSTEGGGGVGQGGQTNTDATLTGQERGAFGGSRGDNEFEDNEDELADNGDDDDDDEIDDFDGMDDENDDAADMEGANLGSGNVPSKSSAFFKPTMDAAKRRGMMSPVLGTEALYKQAGWMTPQEEAGSVPAAASGTSMDTPALSRSASLGGGVVSALGASTSASNIGDDEDDDDEDDDEDEVEEIQTTASEGDHEPRRMVLSIDTSVSSPTAALDLKANVSGRRGRSRGASTTSSVTADGYASARAAREASKSPLGGSRISMSMSLEDDVHNARQSSSQIRSDLLESHHMNVLGLLASASGVAGDGEDDLEDDDEEEEDETVGAPSGDGDDKLTSVESSQEKHATSGSRVTTAATGTAEEEFSIPRSMREIYKISNRNRRHKKTGSPVPLAERGGTVPPSNEKELIELEKAEALLQERGTDAAGFLFTATSNESSGGGETNTSKKSTKSPTGINAEGSNAPSAPSAPDRGTLAASSSNNSQKHQDDLSFFRGIGWIPAGESDSSVTAGCYAQSSNSAAVMSAAMPSAMMETSKHAVAATPGMVMEPPAAPTFNVGATPTHGPYDYSQMGTMPLQAPLSNNPFFAGAALQGGPLAQSFRGEPSSSRKSSSGTPTRAASAAGTTTSATNVKSKGRGGSTTSNTNTNTTERPEKRDGNRTHVYRSSR